MPYADKDKQREYWKNYQRGSARKAYKKEWNEKNKERLAEQQRERVKANPEKYRQYFRNHRIKKVYSLSQQEYAEKVLQQDGKCAVCGSEPTMKWHGDWTLCIDHCHKTGKVRGLLCNACNRAIGLLGDDSERVGSAHRYLVEWTEKHSKEE